MTRDKNARNLRKTTISIGEDQEQWLDEMTTKTFIPKNVLHRLALDVLRWMYERNGRLPKKEEFE